VVFGKLVQILVFGCAYERIADESCSESTLRRRRDEWIGLGLMEDLREISLDAYDRLIGLEVADLAVDCCITKAPCGGEKAGRSPVDRGKGGVKRSRAVVDARGIPLGTITARIGGLLAHFRVTPHQGARRRSRARRVRRARPARAAPRQVGPPSPPRGRRRVPRRETEPTLPRSLAAARPHLRNLRAVDAAAPSPRARARQAQEPLPRPRPWPLSGKLDSGLSPASVQRVHALLHKALKQAVNDGLVARNVTQAVKAPRQSRKEIPTLNREQARVFLEAAKGDRLEVLYLLAIHTGLRQGELLGLKWGDVNLDRGTLQVQRILSAAKNGPTFTTLKTNKGRSVRLTAQAMQALRDHRKRQVEERLKYDGIWQDHGLVFITLVGTPLNRHNVFSRSFKPLLRRAGLPDIPFHALRHSFATLMLAGGEDPKVVQEMMGHSGIRVTMDFYSHVLPDMQKEAVDRLGAVLS
jgi:integrase